MNWLDMNEDLTCVKILRCSNQIGYRNLGIYVFKVKNKYTRPSLSLLYSFANLCGRPKNKIISFSPFNG